MLDRDLLTAPPHNFPGFRNVNFADYAFSAPNARGMVRLVGARTQEAAAAATTLQLVPGAQRWRDGLYLPANVVASTYSITTFQEGLPATFNGLKPRNYQWHGAAFMDACPRGAINADDVGLGKVVETCLVLVKRPMLRPFVVVGPLQAMDAWAGPNADPEKFFGLRVLALRTTKPDEFLEQERIRVVDGRLVKDEFEYEQPVRFSGVFINYTILPAWSMWLQLALDLRCVIVDESHEVRNVRAKQSKMVQKLCRGKTVEKRFFLSATPCVNRLMDLYHQLDCVQPYLWGHYIPFNEKIITSFGTRYCSGHHDGYGWDVDGESNTEEFRQRLANVLVRRTRAQVRGELPPLDRQRMRVPVDALDPVAWKEYSDAADLAKRLGKGAGVAGAELSRLTAMASALSWAKRDVAVKRGLEMARSAETRKLLVMCWYQKTAKHLAAAFKKAGLVTYGPLLGGTAAPKRTAMADAFKKLVVPDGQAAVFVATIGTAGQSLNQLSAASSLLVTDLYWVPSVLIQAEGRVHREGQNANSVLVVYLVVDDTIDSIMWSTLQRKAKSVERATGDDAGTRLVETLGGHSEEESAKDLLAQLAALDESALELT